MNRLPCENRAAILGMLARGNSLRLTSRMANVSINTVTKLLVDVGAASEEYQDKALRNLKCKRIQCDEIWSFVYAKGKVIPAERADELGVADVWTWTAIDSDTKLVPSWGVGRRDADTAQAFIRDVADRLTTRVKLTTDGHKVYLDAVEGAFGGAIDYAMLVKTYECDSGKKIPAERKYSPAVCTGEFKQRITGDPDHIGTSPIHTLMMRRSVRRFTRRTAALSKKVDNHKAALALYFMHYNFAWVHNTLRITPAMAAGVADHVWELDEIVRLTA